MPDDQRLFDAFIQHPDITKQPGHSGEAEAWCPWHNDRTGGKPSLGINFKKRIVKCFVCNEGGARNLADAWGIPLTDDTPPWERPIEATYDYLNPDGTLRFQVVRFIDKSFIQRRPHESKLNEWHWSMKGVQPVLYQLPGLQAANPEQWVFVVEGEKDVDRLIAEGQVATTNSMGAGKWRGYHNKELRGRLVAIIPDNDEAGHEHAAKVAQALSGVAKAVKVLSLPGADAKGADVTDWMDAGHTVVELNQLVGATPPYEPPPRELENPGEPEWKVNVLRGDAIKVTERMQGHGFFVKASDGAAYFFNTRMKRLITLDKDDIELRSLLLETYQINRQDNFFAHLLEHLTVEAHERGQQSVLRMFSHYDRDSDTVLLDMGGGRVLRIRHDDVRVRDNGADGVLFQATPYASAWDYHPDAPEDLVYNTIVKPTNFTDEGPFDVSEQKLLMLLWMLSFAFESMMMFRPIALAVGPAGSGKSSLFRYVGRMLIGPDFDVFSLTRDSKGEEAFWVAITNAPYVVYDNVDQSVSWLGDALATAVTGIGQLKRELRTTNQMARFTPRCMLGITARTPTISLTREDVAGRNLIFSLTTLPKIRPEFEIHDEIAALRDQLMSDYARMVQKALAIPMDSVKTSDEKLRLGDFARIATRIGAGFGAEIKVLTDQVIGKIRLVQNQFATEEDSVAFALSIWVARSMAPDEGQLDIAPAANNGRQVLTRDLMLDIMAIAKEFNSKVTFDSPEKLGRRLTNLRQVLSRTYEIEKGRGRNGSWWRFTVREDPDDPDGEES